VRCAVSAADAVRQAEFVVSAVTAASSVEAAESVKAHLHGKPFFLDINSVSPGRKHDSAKLLGGAARYIDVAVLAPICPARHQTPLLIAGPDSQAVAPTLAGLGMRASIAGAEIGAAAAIKMVRSVMIKGIEALTLECFSGSGACRRHR
jgi:3-hydroxyisobutyrate dehydrogenase-like beta-hydroxyacid dehydrogenase